MANDAMLLSVDEIRFTSPKGFRRRFYAVGIVADNLGKVVVTEPPASTVVRHRPNKGKPGVWDFPGDGYSLYQRTGGLPDIILAHLLIVRDKGATRRVGETIQEIAASSAAKSAIKAVSSAVTTAAPGLGLVLPVVNLISGLLAKKKDKVVWTLSGSLILTSDRKQQSTLSEIVTAPDGDLNLDVDLFLFDGAADEDTLADTNDVETRLKADGLLFTEADSSAASSAGTGG
jgi:hypothetical protein